MSAKKITQKLLLALGQVMPGMIFLLLTRQADANPTGMTVQSGSATTSLSGSRLTVTAGNNAFLNWQSFNIAAGETTIFNQPSSTSVVWNRINNGQSASQIYGSLEANGVVVLLNSSGFYFGPNSFVSAAGLVVSTANCQPPQNAGGAWEFNGPPPLVPIVNYGHIQIGQGGSCFLIAEQVQNYGDIEAPGGSVGLAAGQTVSLSERPDGRGMSMKVTLPQGSVDNYGTLVADAGTISLNAQVVNQDGCIQANSVQNVNGVIELVASDQLNLGASSQISAAGDATAGGSAGGTVTLQSADSFSDATGSEISVAGGAHGGNGGTVEISAPAMPAIHSTIYGTAQAGATGGQLLLDPDMIILDTSGSDSVGTGGTVAVGDDPGGTLYLNVNSAFTGFSKITLQAVYDITLADGTTWNLSSSTGQNSGQLVLEAGRNIIFGNSTALYDMNSWSVALYAGVTTFNSATILTPTVSPSEGSIYLNASDPNNPNEVPTMPTGYIQTASGDISLVAGQDITVGAGRVTTTAGGSILAHALAGNIDTGDDPQGYMFRRTSTAGNEYYVDSYNQVGGISTTGGGNDTLIAGGNVTSLQPVGVGYVYDGNTISDSGNANVVTAGSGCYGSEPGNFTVVAGNDVVGHYLVANGIGSIYAGVQMNAAGMPVTDIAGNYVLGAAGSAGNSLASPNLSLSLITGGWNVTAADNINLQEVNNPNGDFDTRSDAFEHLFNYALTDYVNLTAGNQVQLGSAYSQLPRLDGTELQVPVIYPGILNINAGAGGVVLAGDSIYNQLTLFPSPLGSLTINTTDGGSLRAGYFYGESQADFVLGSAGIFNLIVSDSGNNAYLSGTEGLFGIDDHAGTPVHLNSERPVTLDISGDMDYVFLVSSEAAQISVGGNMDNSRFQGMNLSSHDVSSITVAGNIVNDPSVSDDYGYEIGGGGQFDISAHNLDLGTADGTDAIISAGVGLYNIAGVYPLANLFTTGANININLTGDLDMTFTSIATQNGSSISINAGGAINVGLPGVTVSSEGARGIFTTGQGNVTVIADGDINVAGSRIAAYDGGNVTVESLDGNINAGTGGSGYVDVYDYQVDTETRAVTTPNLTIPGSGILATTFVNDYWQGVGNILVETPRGSINASAGGIVQLPLNTGHHKRKKGAPTTAPRPGSIEVLAGYQLENSAGEAVTAADIASGTPVLVTAGENIDASGSGVIGGEVTLKATGNISGAIFARNDLDIAAQQNVNVTALAEGSINVGAGGTVSGTLIGVGGVNASGSSISASLESNNGVTGNTSGEKGMAQGTAANATSAAASASDASAASTATKTDNNGEDDPLKKKKSVALVRKISRVTVLLPGKN